MHELAITDSIVTTVLGEIEKRKINRVSAVGVRVGALTDVVPESLEFCFEVTTKGTALSGTRLEIERVPIKGSCHACGKNISVENYLFVCPDCNSHDITIIQGDELHIAYLKINEDDRTECETPGREGLEQATTKAEGPAL